MARRPSEPGQAAVFALLLALATVTQTACGSLPSSESPTQKATIRARLDGVAMRYRPYLEAVAAAINKHLSYPCIDDPGVDGCVSLSTDTAIEFGIAKDGSVAFVKVVRSASDPVYEESAVRAIRQAAPFAPIPDDVSRTGMAIRVNFIYAH